MACGHRGGRAVGQHSEGAPCRDNGGEREPLACFCRRELALPTSSEPGLVPIVSSQANEDGPETHCRRTTRSVRTARARTVAVRKQPPASRRRRCADFWPPAPAAPRPRRCPLMAGLRSPPRAGHAGQPTDRRIGPVGSRASPFRGRGHCRRCGPVAAIRPPVHRCRGRWLDGRACPQCGLCGWQ